MAKCTGTVKFTHPGGPYEGTWKATGTHTMEKPKPKTSRTRTTDDNLTLTMAGRKLDDVKTRIVSHADNIFKLHLLTITSGYSTVDGKKKYLKKAVNALTTSGPALNPTGVTGTLTYKIDKKEDFTTVIDLKFS